MKVKMLKWMLPMLALPTLLASCSNDDSPYHVGDAEYVTINSSKVVVEIPARGGYEATDNFLPTRGSLRLFLESSNTDPQYSTEYLKFTCDGNTWTPEENLRWAVGSTANWAAFFTSAANDGYDAQSEAITVTLPNDQSILTDEQFNDLDLLVANGTTSTSKIDVQFEHIHAKLRVNVYNDVGFLDDKNIDNVKFYDPDETHPLSTTIAYSQSKSEWESKPIKIEEVDESYAYHLKKVATQSGCYATYEAIMAISSSGLYPVGDGISGNLILTIDGNSIDIPISNFLFSNRIFVVNVFVGGRYTTKIESQLTGWTEVPSTNNPGLETE